MFDDQVVVLVDARVIGQEPVRAPCGLAIARRTEATYRDLRALISRARKAPEE